VALASIEASEPIEVVIVDDGSTDPETQRVLEMLDSDGHAVIRHERNLGVAEARNTGLGETRAPYVFPLDADDLVHPGALTMMAGQLDANPDAAVCYGDYEEVRRRTRLIRAVPDRIDPFRIAYTNEMPGTALYRRTVLEQIDGWQAADPTQQGYEDWNLWMTLAEREIQGVHLGAGIPVFQYRIHSGRVNESARRRHRQLYRSLRAAHPKLFGDLSEYRARSDLSLARKLLYPVVYGGRPRFGTERPVKRLLDRAGIWTLRR